MGARRSEISNRRHPPCFLKLNSNPAAYGCRYRAKDRAIQEQDVGCQLHGSKLVGFHVRKNSHTRKPGPQVSTRRKKKKPDQPAHHTAPETCSKSQADFAGFYCAQRADHEGSEKSKQRDEHYKVRVGESWSAESLRPKYNRWQHPTGLRVSRPMPLHLSLQESREWRRSCTTG